MATNYAAHVSTKKTPQTEAIPGSAQQANHAGGFSFVVDDWTRLDRFLVLGSEGGTYYVKERPLTQENAAVVLRCLTADAARTVNRIVAVSEAGRAPKNDPAVFALALAMCHGHGPLVAPVLSRVCRIGTHLFQFVAACDQMRGWGRGLRSAVAGWYTARDAKQTAYQMLKYQSRDKWSHRDLLRLTHPKASGTLNDLFHWSVKGWSEVGAEPHPDEALRQIWAFEKLKREPTAAFAVQAIADYGMTREMIPTPLLTDPVVWEALLAKMPLTAMVRNLATMTRIGLLAPLSAAAQTVAAKLGDGDYLRKSRVHPLAVLVALKTYQQGHGERGGNTWTPVQRVVDALDGAFYLAFGNVPVTGKSWLLALDVSGSMASATIAGMANVTARVGSAAMALVTAATEPNHHLVGFTAGGWKSAASGRSRFFGQNNGHCVIDGDGLTELKIGPRQRIDDVCHYVNGLSMGGTDCALPMLYATENKLAVDAFVIYTDNETWAGKVHPTQALNEYRQKMGRPAKLIVVGMTATEFTINDPADAGGLDVCGFDTATPAVLSDFVADGRSAGTGDDDGLI